MKRPGRFFISTFTLAIAALAALAIPGLFGQDKERRDEVCVHQSGKGAVSFDPKKALKSFEPPTVGNFSGLNCELTHRETNALNLPSCRFESEHEIALRGVSLDREIIFADEKTFDRVRHLLKDKTLLLIVGTPEKAFRLISDTKNLEWGLAPANILDLFKVRCLPAVASPARNGTIRVRSLAK